MIDRRTALASLSAMFGAALFAPIARAATAGQPLPGAVGMPVFTAAQRAIVSALSERILPTTDTPGAIAAGVPAFIEQLLGEWGLPADLAPVAAGLATMDARSQLDYKIGAAEATAVQQDALLTLAMNKALPGVESFFEIFRQLVITGYYTSEIGITQEREYLPVPGSYDGAYPVAKVAKIWAA
jgi:gluconate 2-dehydrogenase gamma chain